MRVKGRGTASVLLLLVGICVALKGGVHPRHSGWVIVGIVGLSVFSLVLRGPLQRPRKATRWLMCLLGLGVLIQLVPLPSPARAMLSPGTQALYEELGPAVQTAPDAYWDQIVLHDLEVELGESPDTIVFEDVSGDQAKALARPVSLDPFRTRWVLVVWLAAFCVWALGSRAIGGGAANWLLCGLSALFVGEAVWGLLQIDGTSLGWFEKEHYRGSATGTLVNRNHFGTLMLLGLGALGTAALRFRHQLQKAAIVGCVLCGAALLASQSRAAIVLGLAAVAFFAVRAARGRENETRTWALLAFAGVFTLCGVLWLFSSGRTDGALLEDPSLQGRLDALGHALGEWRGFLFAGAGVGAFGSVASLGHTAPYTFHFEHLHNDFIQTLIEGGILIGAPLIVLLTVSYARAARESFRSSRLHPSLPLALGSGAALLHALVDFPLQIPGILFIFVLLLALLQGEKSVTKTPMAGKRSVLGYIVLAGMLFVSVHSVGLDFLNARTDKLLAAQGRVQDSSVLSSGVEAHLALQRTGGRRRMARLAILRAETVLANQEPKKAFHAFLDAADTARHAIAYQSLAADEYLSAAIALARAAQLSRQLPPTKYTAEELSFASDAAQRQALVLQPTNPAVFLDIAKAQAYLANGSPVAQGHYQRAANALSAAIALEPRSAERAFRIASRLPRTRALTINHGTHGMGAYEASRHWFLRGEQSVGDKIIADALRQNVSYTPLLFLQAERIRATKGEAASVAAYNAFLQKTKDENGLKAWALLWTGRHKEAGDLFQQLLQKNPNSPWLKRGLELVEKGNNTP